MTFINTACVNTDSVLFIYGRL